MGSNKPKVIGEVIFMVRGWVMVTIVMMTMRVPSRQTGDIGRKKGNSLDGLNTYTYLLFIFSIDGYGVGE